MSPESVDCWSFTFCVMSISVTCTVIFLSFANYAYACMHTASEKKLSVAIESVRHEMHICLQSIEFSLDSVIPSVASSSKSK